MYLIRFTVLNLYMMIINYYYVSCNLFFIKKALKIDFFESTLTLPWKYFAYSLTHLKSKLKIWLHISCNPLNLQIGVLLLFMKQLVKNWRIFIKNMQFHKQLIVMSKLCQFYTMSSGNILSILKPIFVYLSMIFLGHLDQTNCGSIWSHVRYTWQYKLTLDCLLFHRIGAVFV